MDFSPIIKVIIQKVSKPHTMGFLCELNFFVSFCSKGVTVVFCVLGSYDRAVLLYEYVGKKTVDLQHTEVPDAFRGRGIAKHLAKVEYYNISVFHCGLM